MYVVCVINTKRREANRGYVACMGHIVEIMSACRAITFPRMLLIQTPH